MEVVLLGTGSDDGWPDPYCTCAWCGALRREGSVRAPTSVLVDDTLLLARGPEAADAAARTGRSLAGVRELFLTAAATAPAEMRLGDHVVRVLEGAHPGAASGFDVTGPDGSRLLFATDPEGLETPPSAVYDVVLLGETGSFTGLPRLLAELRRAGSVTGPTDVVAVHLGHHTPPTAELVRRLAHWGVEAVPDGTVLGAARASDGVRPVPWRSLVLGGARSGKSVEAEHRLAAEADVTYVATARPLAGDAEWAARVAAHRTRRPAAWHTIETRDVATVLRDSTGAVLVDCLALWMGDALERDDLERRVDDLVDAWRSTRARVVAVSNEVGSGVVPGTPSGRAFRDELGRLNARIAAASDDVVLMVAGRPLQL